MYFISGMKVQYYDCDFKERLKLSSAMKYMQQNSSEHLEALGISTSKLLGEQMAFLLTKINVKVHRIPGSGEMLRCGTAVLQPKGVRFVREYVVDTPQGERLISALSHWVMVNPVTHKIYRPASFPYDLDVQQPSLGTIIGDISIEKETGGYESQMSIPVRYSQMDLNCHMNNTVYADLICDALPFEKLAGAGIDIFTASFQNEAAFGDTLDISSKQCEENAYYICGICGVRPCFESFVRLRGEEPSVAAQKGAPV